MARTIIIKIDSIENKYSRMGFDVSIECNSDKPTNDFTIRSAIENGLAERIKELFESYVQQLRSGQ